ncbi:MAG: SDR family NAD(P)-dependent oxidoreductase [Gemmatimonadota bacterium]
MSLEERVAVVTGASTGIGAAVAEALAGRGVRVALAARGMDRLKSTAQALTAGGAIARAVPCDVTDEDAVESLRDQVLRELGPVEILINNAGVATSAPLARTSLEEWNRLFQVNATGTFLCTRTFLPSMMERGWGRVVNVASVAGLAAGPYISAYAASKHAQIGLTRAAAAEAGPRGVTVNAVCPGYVDTGMTRESAARIARRTGRTAEEALEVLRGQNPQHRLIQPREVAHAVLALCADDAGGINGQALIIDGGGRMA